MKAAWWNFLSRFCFKSERFRWLTWRLYIKEGREEGGKGKTSRIRTYVRFAAIV